MRPTARLTRAVVAGILASLLVVFLAVGPLLGRADLAVYDALVRLFPVRVDPSIVVVAIDSRSLQELGPWPWPRDTHAALISRLNDASARGIAYDVLFVEPTQGDATLEAAIAQSGSVFLPMAIDVPGANGAMFEAILPTESVASAVAGLGHVNLVPDADGVVRRAPLSVTAGDTTWPQLVTILSGRGMVMGQRATEGAPSLNDRTLVSWPEGSGAFPTASFVDVLRGETPADFLRGKWVLVGMTAPGKVDQYATPLSVDGALTPGVEVQAALLNTLIQNAARMEVATPWRAVLALLALWGAGFALSRLSARWALAALVGALCGVALMVIAAFAAGFWIPPLAIAAAPAIGYSLWSWLRLVSASDYLKDELGQFTVDDRGRSAPRLGFDHQIDAMREAVSRLRDLNRFIADVLRNLPDATLVLGRDGSIVRANDKAEALFPDARLVGRRWDGLPGSGWTDRTDDDGVAVAPNGRHLKIANGVVQNSDDLEVGQIVRLADVTDLRNAQAERELVLQLLSHDMRAPQTAILRLLDQAGEALDPELRTRIERNAAVTLRIADSYVHLARAASAPMACVVFDLREALFDAIDTLWPTAQAHGIEIDGPGDGDEHLLPGDRTLVTRALMNLVDNAIKFSPSGQAVRCRISTQDEGERRWIVCAIRNHGPSLSAQEFEALSTPFRQKEAGKNGVGLGLALVRTVVERHAGEVTCLETDGTEIAVRFPAWASSEAAQPHLSRPPRGAQTS